MKYTRHLFLMDVHRSVDCSDGDKDIRSPWITRHVFGPDIKGLKVTLRTDRI